MFESKIYRDLYTSKWMKIYHIKQSDGSLCRSIEFALPFFYYVKFTLTKPMHITLGKNKLERESNLLSRASISRILKLLPRNKPHSSEYISVLLTHRKSNLLNYMYTHAEFVQKDLKEYVNQHGFEEFCLKHTFNKKLFDNFYNAIIRSDAEVENWANLTTDNKNIADYAKNKLLNLRECRIKHLQSQYNFNLENIEGYWSNGKYWCIKRSFEYSGKAYSWQTIIDYQGKEIITFSDISVEDITPDGTVIFKDKNRKYGTKDLSGQTVAYEQLGEKVNRSHHSTNDEELKPITNHNHWGYADNSGKIVIPIIFDKVGQFYNGQALVSVNNKYCIIDKYGKQVNTDSIALKLPKTISNQDADNLFRKFCETYPKVLKKLIDA